MKQILTIGRNNIVKVENESLKGFVLDVNCKDNVEAIVTLDDMNKIDISMVIRKKGAKIVLWDGTLLELLIAMYAQTNAYEVFLTQYSSGYKIAVKFPQAYVTRPNEVFEVELDAKTTAFGATLDTTLSTIEFETIPSPQRMSGLLMKVESISIGNGAKSLEEVVGNDVVRMVLLTDPDNTKTYDTSTEAKVLDVTIESNGRQVKDVTENLLIQENIDLINDVDKSPRNLVIYQANGLQERLNNVKVKANFSKAVTSDARLLVVRLVKV